MLTLTINNGEFLLEQLALREKFDAKCAAIADAEPFDLEAFKKADTERRYAEIRISEIVAMAAK